MALALEKLRFFCSMAQQALVTPYPNQPAFRLRGEHDLKEPKELTPVFWGAYDWHSAAHGHWTLARVAHLHRDAGDELGAVAREATRFLAEVLRPEACKMEAAYLQARRSFERPYGLAWLLQLHAELVEWSAVDPAAEPLKKAVQPMASVAATNIATWLPKLSSPTRSGTHAQTAFSLGLCFDWAQSVGEETFLALLDERSRTYYGDDHSYAVHLEPGGEDFLSSSLGAADLMRRILPRDEFAQWFGRVLPQELPFSLAKVSDPEDGRLAHLDGLNLSRAWMLDGIATHFPREDLARLRDEHLEYALQTIDGAHFAGSHWLGTFAVYALTRRGIRRG